MQRKEDIRTFTAEELRAVRQKEGTLTDLAQAESLTEDELERRIAEDEDERDLRPDWTQARLVIPAPKKSLHVRFDGDMVEWFKQQGKGYQTRMNAVLRAYMEAHRHN